MRLLGLLLVCVAVAACGGSTHGATREHQVAAAPTIRLARARQLGACLRAQATLAKGAAHLTGGAASAAALALRRCRHRVDLGKSFQIAASFHERMHAPTR
jgi:hypothetical protein